MAEYEGGDATEPSVKRVRERLNYSYMDGLRGLGAFAVYLTHFVMFYYPL